MLYPNINLEILEMALFSTKKQNKKNVLLTWSKL